PYLAVAEPRGYSIDLTVELQSKMMRAAGIVAQTLARTNARELYWSIDQQLAHLASNGSTVRAGDLCGSGTISGATPDSFGSLLELTWRGTRPLTLGDSEPRAFLTDGDVVMMRGWCEGPSGDVLRIGFGEVRGTVVRAPEQRSE
ncbi:MAG: fumarylacetoacetate hydrolase family protein, partial [Vulcanimicrobiaceae bacterium]